MRLYHGTSIEAAKSIETDGVLISKCSKGYFGLGFYLAEDLALARSNYAELSEDGDAGVILEFELKDEGLLDLSIEKDWTRYRALGLERDLASDALPQKSVALGVNAVRDVGSMGGWVVYNPMTLELIGPVDAEMPPEAPRF